MKRQKMVMIKVPLEFAGVVAGALDFALITAQGWPAALARSEDSLRCVDAVCSAIQQLRAARKAAQEGKAKP